MHGRDKQLSEMHLHLELIRLGAGRSRSRTPRASLCMNVPSKFAESSTEH
jgi:hypothetical protein